MTSTILSKSQVEQYRQEGYLLVSGLIPADIATKAEVAMWESMGVDPNDRDSWAQVKRGATSYENTDLVACYTPEFIAAAAQLAADDPTTFRRPSRGFALNIFPSVGEWKWPGPHIDHAIKAHGHKTFPRAFRIAAMTYLSDIEQHGAGTVVWPKSHHQIEALAKQDLERYEYMWVLNSDLDKAGLGEPLELTPKRGDVLFYHYLCAHAGSTNLTDRPRLAMNAKW